MQRDVGWFAAPENIFDRTDLTSIEKLVLLDLCRLIDEEGIVSAYINEIAEHCSLAEKTISRAIDGLSSKNMISVRRRGAKPREYRLKDVEYRTLSTSVRKSDSERPVPRELQRIWAVSVLLSEVPEHSLARIALRPSLRLPPKKRRSPEKAREELLRRVFSSSEDVALLASILSSDLYGVKEKPEPVDLLRVLGEYGFERAIMLATLWGMGEEVDDEVWDELWRDWIVATRTWRKNLTPYTELGEAADMLAAADEIVKEAKQEIAAVRREMIQQAEAFRMKEEQILKDHQLAIKKMAEAHRQALAALSEENANLKAQIRELLSDYHLNRSLATGRTIAILGDPSRTNGYREAAAELGIETIFANALDRNECRRILSRKFDAIVLVAAYAKHSARELIAAISPSTPLFYLNRSGLGEFKRVIEQEIIPAWAGH